MAGMSLELEWDSEAIFLSRPNRFLARVLVAGMEEEGPLEVHVHDPGRLKEILVPGNRLLVRRAPGGSRKTGWDLLAGRVGDNWVLVNSSLHRPISQSILMDPDLNPFGRAVDLRPEVRIGRSRLDYLMTDEHGRDVYIEVKGCSLTVDGIAIFPDAPTSRGTRHLEELIDLVEKGHRAGIMILVVGPEAECFFPNFETDPIFSQTFLKAIEAGVETHPLRFRIEDREIRYFGPLPICRDIPGHM